MMVVYFLVLALAAFAAGMGGAALSRHFLTIMFSIEIMMGAAALAAVAMFSLVYGFNILIVLLAIWSIVTAETVAFIALYRYMVNYEVSLDVTRLSKYRDR